MTRALRVQLPCLDENSLASHLGAHLASGGIFLTTHQQAQPGEVLRFELTSPDGTLLFSGQGVVVRANSVDKPGEPAGLLLRFQKLVDNERATLDRLLLARDGADDLGRPTPINPKANRVNAPPARVTLALDIGGTLARAAVLRGGKPTLVPLGGSRGTTRMSTAVALDEKGRLLLGQRARTQAGLTPRSAISSPLPLLALDPVRVRDRAWLDDLPFPVRDDERGPVADLPQRAIPAIELFAAVATELRGRAQDFTGQALLEAHLAISTVYTPRTRHLLQEALKQAGFATAILLHNSLCIAAAHGFRPEAMPPGKLLVIDWGGTTLHVSVLGSVEGKLMVLASGARHHLGGELVTEHIAGVLFEALEQELGEPLTDPLARQRVLEAAESAQVSFSEQPEVHVRIPWVATAQDGRPVDLDVHLEAASARTVLDGALEQVRLSIEAVLQAAEVNWGELHQVLLAGGQCCDVYTRQRISSLFPEQVVVKALPQPDTAVVLGAVELAELRTRIKPKTGTNLGRSVNLLGADGELLELFAVGTPLPAQTSIRVKPKNGVGLFCALMEGSVSGESRGYIGSGRLPGVSEEVQVLAQIDERGAIDLHLTTLPPPTGTENGARIQSSRVRLVLTVAEASVEASVFAQRAMPGEPEIWAPPTFPKMAAAPPSSASASASASAPVSAPTTASPPQPNRSRR